MYDIKLLNKTTKEESLLWSGFSLSKAEQYKKDLEFTVDLKKYDIKIREVIVNEN